MVVIQPSTQKVVIIEDKRTHRWMLPRGRKDVGESLEQTALREAFEEVHYTTLFVFSAPKRSLNGSRQDSKSIFYRCTRTLFNHTHLRIVRN